MIPEPATAAPAAASDTADIGRWRERLLGAILRTGLVVGLAPAAASVSRALHTGDWLNSVVSVGILGFVAMLAWGRSIAYRVRAWSVMLLLYAVGVWLTIRVGAVMQIYLLACPVLATLLLSSRIAIVLLVGCSATLVGVGWAFSAHPTIPGYEANPLMMWLNFGTNTLLVGALMTLSCAFLLRRLEQSLAQQRAASESLRANQETLRQIAAQVPGMVYRLRIDPDGKPQYIYVSPGVRQLFGVEPEALLGDGSLLRRLWHPDDRARIEVELRRVRETGLPLELEYRVLLPDGRERWVQSTSTAVSSDERGVVRNGIMIDITERKASEALVWRQANFDALTGLPNRRMLRDRLEQEIGRIRRDRGSLTLMLIDLDHFKEVNDTLGHDSGDQLLIDAAARIRGCVRETDTVARMGGDEFTVVLAGAGGSDRVDLIANQIIERLSAEFTVGEERVHVSASIGITLFPGDADQIEGLLKNADQALYVAKGAGRNCFRYFTPALQEQAQARARIANDLRDALARDEFRVHYQPIVELGSGRIFKAEALIRWQHPERGMVRPDVFIPIAESSGLIGDIGDWVFRTAAAQVQRWRDSVHPQFQISVNRSPVQFRADGNERQSWAEHLQGLGLPGQSIAVEITEGLLLDASECVGQQLIELRDAGIAVSLDDFGTGYSAMSYLQKFDIDFLKIDRSFVAALNQGAGRPLCKAMIVMAHELGMKVVAEGVETAEQRDWLRSAGCDYAQGYLFAKPMPADELEAFLAQRLDEAASVA